MKRSPKFKSIAGKQLHPENRSHKCTVKLVKKKWSVQNSILRWSPVRALIPSYLCP